MIREKLVFTPVDSARIKAMVHCPDGKPVDIKPTIVKGKKQATAIFGIKDGVASVECLCDSLAMVVKETERERDVFKQRLNSIESEEKTIEKVVTNESPRWMKILAGIGVFSLLFWAFKFYKFLKSKFPFIP